MARLRESAAEGAAHGLHGCSLAPTAAGGGRALRLYDYKKQKVAKKLAEKQESRIRRAEVLPAVNAELAQRLLSPPEEDKPRKRGKKKSKQGLPVPTEANPLGDDRFGAMFTDERFQVDESTEGASCGAARQGRRSGGECVRDGVAAMAIRRRSRSPAAAALVAAPRPGKCRRGRPAGVSDASQLVGGLVSQPYLRVQGLGGATARAVVY